MAIVRHIGRGEGVCGVCGDVQAMISFRELIIEAVESKTTTRILCCAREEGEEKLLLCVHRNQLRSLHSNIAILGL